MEKISCHTIENGYESKWEDPFRTVFQSHTRDGFRSSQSKDTEYRNYESSYKNEQ